MSDRRGLGCGFAVVAFAGVLGWLLLIGIVSLAHLAIKEIGHAG